MTLEVCYKVQLLQSYFTHWESGMTFEQYQLVYVRCICLKQAIYICDQWFLLLDNVLTFKLGVL